MEHTNCLNCNAPIFAEDAGLCVYCEPSACADCKTKRDHVQHIERIVQKAKRIRRAFQRALDNALQGNLNMEDNGERD